MALRTPEREQEQSGASPSSGQGLKPVSSIPAEQLERIPTASQKDIDKEKASYKPSESGKVYEDNGALKDDIVDGTYGKRLSSRKLKNLEKASKEGGATGGGKDEVKKLDDKAKKKGFSYTGDDNEGGFSLKKLKGKFTRRRTAGIAAAAVLGVSGVGLFTIASGPLQAIHLAQILQSSFGQHEDTVSTRTQGFYRYYKTGNVGETRLGFFSSKMNAKITADLQKVGITINPNTRTGQLGSINIDRRINPELSGLTSEEAKARIARDFGIAEDKIRVSGNGLFTVDGEFAKIGQKRTFIYKSLDLVYKGKISTGVAGRIVTKYLDAPSLFSPMKRAQANLKTRAERIKQQREKNRETTKRTPEAETRASKIRDKLGGKITARSATGGLLTFTGGLCLAKDVVGEVSVLNRENGPIPAAKGAFSAISHGSQAMFGGNFTSQQLGDFVATFTNEKGESIWQSRELNELQGKQKGKPAEPGVKQSFSPNSTTANIEKDLDSVGADIACSPLGIGAQIVAGAVLLAGTGGAGTVVVKSASGIVSGIVIGELIQALAKLVSNEPLADQVLNGGPVGGSLLAYGAEEGSGIVARSMGGTAFSAETSQQIRTAQIEKDKAEFAQESLATRIFDVYDHRSLAASAIESQSGSVSTNVENAFASMFNFQGWVGSITSLFTSKASAQERPYDWSLPKYGFSSKILNSPKYENPYENADIVAGLLDDNADDYNDKAMNCFGVSFEKGENGWQVNSEKDVNPASKDYQDADCEDQDENWIRVRLFILDTKTMASFACINGDENDADIQAACAEFGIGVSGNTGEQNQTSIDPPDTINGYSLSDNEKKHLKYIAENVVSKLDGLPEAQAKFAALSAWWSLRESVLDLDNPFGYSNCADSGNDHIGYTDPCTKALWQVGIGAVMATNPSQDRAAVLAAAKKYYPSKSLSEIINGVSVLAGKSAGSPEYNQAASKTGELQKSLILRDPVIGISQVNGDLKPCLKETPLDWCLGGKTEIAGSKTAITNSIGEIEAYFLRVLTNSSDGLTTPGGIPTADQLGRNSDKLECADGSRDLGVVTTKYTGEIKKEAGALKIRLCELEDIPGGGNNTTGGSTYNGAVVDARVSGAWVALARAAKKDGVKLTASSSFRLADSCGGTGDGVRCARPGKSLHQTGLAIDFAGMNGFTPTGGQTCSSRMTSPGAQYAWMKNNASKFGVKQYSAESWHWDFLPGANRC